MSQRDLRGIRVLRMLVAGLFSILLFPARSHAAIWYVNDTSTAGDSFTQAFGYDTNNGTTPSTPKRTLNGVDTLLSAGDTVFIDAGRYYEFDTVTIDTNGVFLIGMDSVSTRILFDTTTAAAARAFYASGRTNLTISNMFVTGGRYAVWFVNVDSSYIERIEAPSHGVNGILLDAGSDSNTLRWNTLTSNPSHGVALSASSNNRIESNTASGGSADGFRVANGSNNNLLSTNNSNNNVNYGITILNSSSNTIGANSVTSNYLNGIQLDSAVSNTVTLNTVTGNLNNGVMITNASSANSLSLNTISGNSFSGVVLDSTTGNTLTSNTSSGNPRHGFHLDSAYSNVLITNSASGNLIYGFYLDSSVSNALTSNTSTINSNAGILLHNSSRNTLTSNVSRRNNSDGFRLIDNGGGSGSDSNVFIQNTSDSNAGYAFAIENNGTPVSRNDTFANNVIITTSLSQWIDSGVRNSTSNRFSFARNYWARGGTGTTDSATIRGMTAGDGRDSIIYIPFRLGIVDTAFGLDTVAPKAPDTVVAETHSATSIRLRWARTTASEEGESAVTIGGFKIYRSTTSDTSLWAFLDSTSSSVDTYIDTGISFGTTYYYRVTAYDAKTPFPNESFLSDSIPAITPIFDTSGPNAWYVNDLSVVGDSFSQAVGADPNDGWRATKPKRTVSDAVRHLTTGDTLYIDAGTFTAESFTIPSDTVWIIGIDSSVSIIDAGDSATASVTAVGAAGRIGIKVRNLRVQNAFKGFDFNNVDNSVFETISVRHTGGAGILLRGGSDSNVIRASESRRTGDTALTISGSSGCSVINNRFYDATSHGIGLSSSTSNFIDGNTIDSAAKSGLMLVANSVNNWVSNNTITGSAESGVQLAANSNSCTFYNNSVDSNRGDGFHIGSSNNLLSRNIARYNRYSGYRFASSSGNSVVHSIADSNGQTGVYFEGSSSSDTATKMTISPTPGDTSFVMNATSSVGWVTRTWWTTTDTITLAGKIGGAGGQLITYSPFRFSAVDTALGADTVAPRAPDTFVADTNGATSIKLRWMRVTGSEESESIATIGGYRIFRSQTRDTSYWALLDTTTPTTDTYLDSGLTTNTPYFYRISVYDAKSPFPNESYFSDSIPGDTPTVDTNLANVWYVNDSSTSGDALTSAVGYDTNSGLYAAEPRRNLSYAMRHMTPGDTIYIDAGTYYETLLVSTDTIFIIGKDSSSTIIDPRDSATTSIAGVYANTKNAFQISNLRVRNAYDGVHLRDASRALLTSILVQYVGGVGVRFDSRTRSVELRASDVERAGGASIRLDSAASCTVVGNFLRNGSGVGMQIDSSPNNFIRGNRVETMTLTGMIVAGPSSGNWFESNIVRNSGQGGWQVTNGADNCTFVSNTADSHGGRGMAIMSAGNYFAYNAVKNNALAGIYFLSSSGNRMIHDFVLSNSATEGGVYFQGTSSNNTVEKLTVVPKSGDTSYVLNGTDTPISITRSWWGTADSLLIQGRFVGAGNRLITYAPFRLTELDTSLGADTVAPRAPDTVVASKQGDSAILVSWATTTASEEPEAALGLSGYRVYRSRSTSDTRQWSLVGTYAAGMHTHVDSGHGANETWYFRITAVDTKTPFPNESYYSDSIAFASTESGTPVDTTRANVWYVNDSSSAGDSYTTTIGNDSNSGISPAAPLRTLGFLEPRLSAGDTVYIDRGTFVLADTFSIETNAIALFGVDSAVTILDFNNTSAESFYTLYASNAQTIRVSDLKITRGYNALLWNNIDNSFLTRIAVSGNGFRAIEFYSGSNGNQITACDVRDNASTGLYLTSSSSNLIRENRISGNAGTGIILSSGSSNLVDRNVLFNNGAGILSGGTSSSNIFTQNTIDSNLAAAMNYAQTSSDDVFTKNVIRPSTVYPDSLVQNLSSNAQNVARNWWSTTDSGAILRGIATAGATPVTYQPFRLGVLDTSAGADTAAPAAPPSLGASGIDSTRIRVSWTPATISEEGEAAPAIFAYRVYRARTADSTYWARLTEVSSAADSVIDTTVLLFETWFYRVTVIDTKTPYENEGFFSAVSGGVQAGHEVTAPETFSLLLPAAGVETAATAINFYWGSANDSNRVIYRLIIDTDLAGSYVFDSTTAVDSMTASLPANDTYKWQVIATDTWGAGTFATSTSGTTTTTAVFSLAIDTRGPTAPALLNPPAQGDTSATAVKFRWSASFDSIAGLSNYRIQIDTGSQWGVMAADSTTGSATETVIILRANDTYFWRVIAFDDLGNTSVSDTRRLVIETMIAVTLATPLESSTVDSRPTFYWTGSSLDTYLWQISASAAFTTIKEDRLWFSGETYNQSIGLESGFYYWRVSAFDRYGNSETTAGRVVRVDTSLSDLVPPDAFSLASPADGTESSATTIVFAWSATTDGGSGVQSYALVIDTSGLFTAPLSIDTVNASILSFTKTLAGTDSYFWRVIARDEAGNTTATPARKILIDTVPPAAATALTPESGAETNVSTVRFTWTSASDTHSGIQYHRLQLSTSSTFASLLFDSSTGLNSSGSLTLPVNETFHWRVIAADDAGNTATSSVTVLRTDTIPPSASTPLTPADGAETRATTLTFSWSASTDADSHRLQLSTFSGFTTILIDSATGASTSAVLALAADTWYWRVVTQDALGNTVVSSSLRFVIDTQSPTGPSLSSPANLFETNARSITFAWNAGAGASTHKLQIATSQSFATLTADSSTAGLSTTVTLGANDTYHWRVISQDASGNTTVSESRAFLVDTTPPSPGTPSAPAGGVETGATSIKFRWTAGTDTLTSIDAYRLQVSLESAFAAPILDLMNAGTAAETTPNFLFSKSASHYWRISARDRVGNWDTGLIAHFVRPTPSDTEPPVAVSDLAANANTDATITVCWLKSPSSDMTGGGQYNIYWDAGTGIVSETAAPLAVAYHNGADTRFCHTTGALQTGRLYSFVVRAQDRNGNQNSDSTKVSAWSASEAAATPHAVISHPRSGLKVLREVALIAAEISPETRISEIGKVHFQYRPDTTNNAAAWRNMIALTEAHPNPAVDSDGNRFAIQWNIKGATTADSAVESGIYQLRAMAVTRTGVSDSTPPVFVFAIVENRSEADRRDTKLTDGKVKAEEKIHKGRDNNVVVVEDSTSVDLALPEGILTGDTDTLAITIDPNSSDAAPPGMRAMSGIVDVSLASGQTAFVGKTVTVTISYEDSDDNGVVDGTNQNVADLNMYTYSGLVWEKGGSRVIDTARRTVRCEFSHFSTFILVGAGAVQGDLSRFSVYPNPYVPNDGNANNGVNFDGSANSGITFINLPAKVRLRVFTVTGKKVFEFSTLSSTGAIQWDTKNDENRLVASGVYYFVIDDRGTGQVVTGKLAIVR